MCVCVCVCVCVCYLKVCNTVSYSLEEVLLFVRACVLLAGPIAKSEDASVVWYDMHSPPLWKRNIEKSENGSSGMRERQRARMRDSRGGGGVCFQQTKEFRLPF